MLFWWGGSVPTYSLSYTLPTMVANLGYSAVKAQALTTPPYIFATCVCVTVGWLSDKYQRRFYSIMGAYTLGLMQVPSFFHFNDDESLTLKNLLKRNYHSLDNHALPSFIWCQLFCNLSCCSWVFRAGSYCKI
jgi:MFS family permease